MSLPLSCADAATCGLCICGERGGRTAMFGGAVSAVGAQRTTPADRELGRQGDPQLWAGRQVDRDALALLVASISRFLTPEQAAAAAGAARSRCSTPPPGCGVDAGPTPPDPPARVRGPVPVAARPRLPRPTVSAAQRPQDDRVPNICGSRVSQRGQLRRVPRAWPASWTLMPGRHRPSRDHTRLPGSR